MAADKISLLVKYEILSRKAKISFLTRGHREHVNSI